MSQFVRAAKRQDIPSGSGVASECNGKPVSIFNVAGEFYATQGKCPHRGGPLDEGELEGQVVTCPWHAWRFDVCTGINADNPHSKLVVYPVKLEGDDVLVEMHG
ncbi:MAG: Rieske 2Fe-2S domain-containing protein [Deltaproteobacteria bacterium]|nr:Rieske 2Fe-2S domain-containing protein [Deltaproteobacteria bacterium]